MKTLVHELNISYSRTEWYLLFFPSEELQVHRENPVHDGRNMNALVNL